MGARCQVPGSDSENVASDVAEASKRTKLSQPKPLKEPSEYHKAFFNRIEHISYKDLYKRNIVRRNFKFIDLQLLKIITSKQNSGDKGSYRARYQSKPQKEQFIYSRMFLCRVVDQKSKQDSETCVYLVESSRDNKSLWTHSPSARDDGTICPGTIFRVTHIQKIEYQIGNVDCIVSTCPVLVLETPSDLLSVPIKRQIEPDHTFGFCLKNHKVNFYDVTPVNTSCSGLFCDKQGAYELKTSGKCGCYQQLHGKSKLALCINLTVESDDGEEQCAEEYFSSNQFSKYYQIGNFPSSINEHEFIMNNNSSLVSDALEQCTEYVNANGGWTVIGWYRLGRVTDKMLAGVTDDDDAKTVGTSLTSHIIQIYPSMENFDSSAHKEALEQLKYNASRLYQAEGE